MISEKVEASLKQATLDRNEPLKMTLRNIKAKFLEEIKNNRNQPLSEESEIKVLEKMVKDRLKSIEMCAGKGESGDKIAENEKREIEVINKFLPEKPAQMTTEEIEAAVKSILQEGGFTSLKEHMGKAMGAFTSKFPGQDKKVVSEKIRSSLS